MNETTARRLGKASLACLGLALLSLVGIPAGCAMLPNRQGWDNLGDALNIVGIGLLLAALFAVGSMVSGTLCARQRKIVLLWVAPLWAGACWGAIFCLVEYVVLPVGSRTGLIPGAASDGAWAILGFWLGGSALAGIALWVHGVLTSRRLKYAPWWSVPLWGAVPLAVMAMFFN